MESLAEKTESHDDQHVIEQVLAFRAEADDARRRRINKNERNRNAYHSLQDWSHKIEGQSKEFLPKVSETTEQFAAFIKRSLIQFGDWFSVDAPGLPISEESIRRLVKMYLDELPDGEMGNIAFSTRIADGTKMALLEAQMILKVHGYKVNRTVYVEEGEKLVSQKKGSWRLQVDLIPSDDHYPDPTGRGLYEIHEVERDLHHVQRLAEQGVYDMEVVRRIQNDFARAEDQEREKSPEEQETSSAGYRKRIVITEFWGTLLNQDGSIYKERAFLALANHKYVIRKPADNPFWHGQSPFVVIPLIRDPLSVWHKALYDQVVPLNLALNEMFNLMLDGGLASVWGVRQFRPDYLSDPTQAANGIPQGKTLVLRDDVPIDAKVLEQITTGQVPQDAMAMYNLLDREYNASALTNDLKMGFLPQKTVKATEILEIQQSQSIVLESIVDDMQRKMESLIYKAWLTILQNMDDLSVVDVSQCMSRKELVTLARMSPRERFAVFANNMRFRVYGLSATMARARDFQRMMAMLQVVSSSPLLAPAFMRRASPDKIIDRMFKQLNLNPRDVERSEEEMAQMQSDLQMAQQLGLAAPKGTPSGVAGEAGMQSEINQEVSQSSGL